MLPKIPSAVFEHTLPVTKQLIHYRPYTVREEKILLIAAASDNPRDMVNAVKQVISNCIIDEDVDVSKLHIFDLEVLLLLLRIVSTSNEVELKYQDTEDNKVYDFSVNLEDVIAESTKNITIVDSNIRLKDDIGIIMKPLTIDIMFSGDLDKLNDPNEMYSVLQNLIDKIYDEENVYIAADASAEEFVAFIDSFDKESRNKLSAYFTDMPKLHHTLKYTNSKGTSREIRLEGVTDFFQ